MTDVEPALSRVAFQQQQSNGNTIATRSPLGPTRIPASPRLLTTPATPEQERGTDPLSAHIFARTQSSADQNAESPSFRRGLSDLVLNKDRNDIPTIHEVDKKDRKKRVSFFAKLRGKDPMQDEGLMTAEDVLRSEGTNASTFSPNHSTEKPTFIRVRSNNKPNREFDNLFLAQELFGESVTSDEASTASSSKDSPTNAIWAMKFSKDGKYLATGGQDMVVRVWRVLSSSKDRNSASEGEHVVESTLTAPVFCAKPYREYPGHTADVLDLSWSKNNFLLSSSMDKTVRLWHISQAECLCCFQHTDFVTSIAFHPKDDKYFLSGSLDCKLRLWSIPEKKVANWNELPELVTAVTFDPSGRMAIAGSFTGLCLFYETDGLRYHTQIHVKSSRGRNSHGSKITGIEAVSVYPDNPHGEVKLLITSNDSRIRQYNLRDKSLETKYKGNANKCSQIRATFNDDLSYVICGSEDREVYIWSVDALAGRKDKKPYEHFESHTRIVTATAFAPNSTRDLLAESADPIYNISSSNAHKNPSAARSTHSVENSSMESPRHNPSDGNIIVCADYSGHIKIFRQWPAVMNNNRPEQQSDSVSMMSRPHRKASIRTMATSESARPPSVMSPESPSIKRKPHEAIVPSSPARARTATTESANSNSAVPRIQSHGSIHDTKHGEHETPDHTRNTKSHSPMHFMHHRLSKDASHETQHHQHQRQEQHKSHSHKASHTSEEQKSVWNEGNPYLSEGGVSLEYYNNEPSHGPNSSLTRPVQSRMQSTASWHEMSLHEPISCHNCGSHSFVATRHGRDIRLSCQTCHAAVENE